MREGTRAGFGGRVQEGREERRTLKLGVEVFCFEDRHGSHRTQGPVGLPVGAQTLSLAENGDNGNKFRRPSNIYR
jgi:hypothetical protein